MDQVKVCRCAAKKHLDPLFNPVSSSGLSNTEEPGADQIEDHLFNHLRSEAQVPVYIVVDGVDEFNELHRLWLIGTLIEKHESTSSQSRFKILLSSRDDCDFGEIQKLPSTVGSRTKVFTLDIQPKDTDTDIKSFIQRELALPFDEKTASGSDSSSSQTQHRTRSRSKSNLQGDILKTLIKCANGMFLWVYYQLKIIRAIRTASSIRAHLKKLEMQGQRLADGINDFYKQTMERFTKDKDDDREIARKVFALLIHASGPIKVDALIEGIFVGEDCFEDWKKKPADITRVCRHLVDMDADEDLRFFRWTHYSVYQYFVRNDKDSPKEPHRCIAFSDTSDSDLVADMCLSYLRRDIFSANELMNSDKYRNNRLACLREFMRDNPFLEFASTQWASHSQTSMSSEVKSSLLELCKKESNMQFAFQVFLLSRNAQTVESVGVTHIISYFQLSVLFEELNTENLLKTNSRSSNGFTAMHWAIECYNHLADNHQHQKNVLATVEGLVKYKADINAMDFEGRTPLFLAAKQGYQNVVKKLLEEKGILVDRHSKMGTPLIIASYQGHTAVVEQLLNAGAKITKKSEHGTALHAAVSQGSKDCVSAILNSKAARYRSLDRIASDIGTPLHEACYFGLHEIVKLLLDNKFRVNRKSKGYGSPLQATAAGCYKGDTRTGFKEILQLLLQSGADVNARGGEFTTALNAAVYNEQPELVKILLEKGANIHVNSKYGTALKMVEEGNHPELVEIFRELGANKAKAPKHVFGFYKRRHKPRGKGKVPSPGGLSEQVYAIPFRIFMRALRADDGKRMDIFFAAYNSVIRTNSVLSRRVPLEGLAHIGARVFRDTTSFTVRRYKLQAGKSDPASQLPGTKRQFPFYNKWVPIVKIKQQEPTTPESETEDFPFYSNDPAFRALDRLTNMAVSILSHAIDTKKVEAVKLLSEVWVGALHHVHHQDDIGDDMLGELIKTRAIELISFLRKDKMEAGKGIARAAVQLLATAIGSGEVYETLVRSLARIWACAMRDIHKLGEKENRDYLSPLLDTVIETVEEALGEGNIARIDELAQVIIAVFVNVVTEKLDSLFDKIVKICLRVWDMITESEHPQGELLHQVFEGRADTFINFLRSVVSENRKDVLEFVKEQSDDVAKELNAVILKYQGKVDKPSASGG
ncbi:Ankyrin-3 [Arthrobotrys entomopaga]|nr:Ankyrin-3 [Arthrobotrys entomopaga]